MYRKKNRPGRPTVIEVQGEKNKAIMLRVPESVYNLIVEEGKKNPNKKKSPGAVVRAMLCKKYKPV